MCGDPLTIGLMALSGLGTYAQYRAIGQQADAQSAMYNAQAEQDRQNALIEQGKSKQIAQQYADEQVKLDEKRRLIRGQNAAEMGAAGLIGGTGSGLDLLNASNQGYQQDSMRLLTNQRNATTDSWIRQANLLNSASANEAAASNTQAQKKASQFATILGGVSSMAGTWNTWGTAGSGANNVNLTYTQPSMTFAKTKKLLVGGD